MSEVSPDSAKEFLLKMCNALPEDKPEKETHETHKQKKSAGKSHALYLVSVKKPKAAADATIPNLQYLKKSWWGSRLLLRMGFGDYERNFVKNAAELVKLCQAAATKPLEDPKDVAKLNKLKKTHNEMVDNYLSKRFRFRKKVDRESLLIKSEFKAVEPQNAPSLPSKPLEVAPTGEDEESHKRREYPEETSEDTEASLRRTAPSQNAPPRVSLSEARRLAKVRSEEEEVQKFEKEVNAFFDKFNILPEKLKTKDYENLNVRLHQVKDLPSGLKTGLARVSLQEKAESLKEEDKETVFADYKAKFEANKEKIKAEIEVLFDGISKQAEQFLSQSDLSGGLIQDFQRLHDSAGEKYKTLNGQELKKTDWQLCASNYVECFTKMQSLLKRVEQEKLEKTKLQTEVQAFRDEVEGFWDSFQPLRQNLFSEKDYSKLDTTLRSLERLKSADVSDLEARRREFEQLKDQAKTHLSNLFKDIISHVNGILAAENEGVELGSVLSEALNNLKKEAQKASGELSEITPETGKEWNNETAKRYAEKYASLFKKEFPPFDITIQPLYQRVKQEEDVCRLIKEIEERNAPEPAVATIFKALRKSLLSELQLLRGQPKPDFEELLRKGDIAFKLIKECLASSKQINSQEKDLVGKQAAVKTLQALKKGETIPLSEFVDLNTAIGRVETDKDSRKHIVQPVLEKYKEQVSTALERLKEENLQPPEDMVGLNSKLQEMLDDLQISVSLERLNEIETVCAQYLSNRVKTLLEQAQRVVDVASLETEHMDLVQVEEYRKIVSTFREELEKTLSLDGLLEIQKKLKDEGFELDDQGILKLE